MTNKIKTNKKINKRTVHTLFWEARNFELNEFFEDNKDNIDINSVVDGYTLLHVAIMTNRFWIAKELYEMGAFIKNKWGKTAIELALDLSERGDSLIKNNIDTNLKRSSRILYNILSGKNKTL